MRLAAIIAVTNPVGKSVQIGDKREGVTLVVGEEGDRSGDAGAIEVRGVGSGRGGTSTIDRLGDQLLKSRIQLLGHLKHGTKSIFRTMLKASGGNRREGVRNVPL